MPHGYSLRSKMSSQKDDHASGGASGGKHDDMDLTKSNEKDVFRTKQLLGRSPTRTVNDGRKSPEYTDYLNREELSAHAMQDIHERLNSQKTQIDRLNEQLARMVSLMEMQATAVGANVAPQQPKDTNFNFPQQQEKQNGYEFPTELTNQSVNPLLNVDTSAKRSGTIQKNTRRMHTGGKEANATGQNGSDNNDQNPPRQFSLSRSDNREITFAFTKWDPEWWFQNLESQMLYKHITDDQAKYWVVMNNLGEEKRTIGDAFRGVVEGRKYESLKEIVLRKFTKTRQQKLHELFSELRAEGRKPSELFYHMEQLAQGEIKEGAIYTWWLTKLPYNVQAILPATYNQEKIVLTLNEADRLYELLKRQQDPIFEVSESPKHENALIARLEAIEKSLKDQKDRAKTRSRSKSRTRDDPSKSEYCYYHERFKKKAYRCKGNCAWKGKLAEKPKTNDNNDKKKSKDQSEDTKN